MDIVLILASPLARILDLSTTLRCEHSAEGGFPPEGIPPPLPARSVINPTPGVNWDLPVSVLELGLSLGPPFTGGRKAGAFSGSSAHAR